MNHEIEIGGKKIAYAVRKHPRARRIILRIKKNGEVIVSIPRSSSVRLAALWVYTKRAWIAEQLAKVLALPAAASKAHLHRQYAIHRAAAHHIVKELLDTVNAHYHFTYHKVTIRNQSTRWGSCSRSGNINFNYKIVFLPKELQKYIVAHELCHLRELNHSARFWHLVAEVVPNHLFLRQLLRKHSL